jgi:hypothetical protein
MSLNNFGIDVCIDSNVTAAGISITRISQALTPLFIKIYHLHLQQYVSAIKKISLSINFETEYFWHVLEG